MMPNGLTELKQALQNNTLLDVLLFNFFLKCRDAEPYYLWFFLFSLIIIRFIFALFQNLKYHTFSFVIMCTETGILLILLSWYYIMLYNLPA